MKDIIKALSNQAPPVEANLDLKYIGKQIMKSWMTTDLPATETGSKPVDDNASYLRAISALEGIAPINGLVQSAVVADGTHATVFQNVTAGADLIAVLDPNAAPIDAKLIGCLVNYSASNLDTLPNHNFVFRAAQGSGLYTAGAPIAAADFLPDYDKTIVVSSIDMQDAKAAFFSLSRQTIQIQADQVTGEYSQLSSGDRRFAPLNQSTPGITAAQQRTAWLAFTGLGTFTGVVTVTPFFGSEGTLAKIMNFLNAYYAVT